MYKVSQAFVILLLASAFVVSQSLPAGKWRLEEYEFNGKAERPLKGVDVTLNIKADGKLGGSSGCNAYGGSYSTEDGKLKIADIISMMRACEEPTPQFEKGFFQTLENAVSADAKGDSLVIRTKDADHYLRFVRVISKAAGYGVAISSSPH